MVCGGSHTVLSSCVDQTTSSSAQKSFAAPSCPLTVQPTATDSAIDSTLSIVGQTDFDLPPPMSDLSSAVADAAASHNISSVCFLYPCLMIIFCMICLDENIVFNIAFSSPRWIISHKLMSHLQ